METRSERKAGPQPVPPEGVLTDPTPRSPMDPEESLAVFMGDREVPLVGGDQTAARGRTSGPEDTTGVLEWVPAREPVSNHTRVPSVLSSLEQAEPAAATAALGHAQQRPLAPTLDVGSQPNPTLDAPSLPTQQSYSPTLEMGSTEIPTLVGTAAARIPTFITGRKEQK